MLSVLDGAAASVLVYATEPVPVYATASVPVYATIIDNTYPKGRVTFEGGAFSDDNFYD